MRGDDQGPEAGEAASRKRWTPNGKKNRKPGRKKKRVILATSFTIDQVNDFLDLFAELNGYEYPLETIERPGIGRVVMKFRAMKLKHRAKKSKRPPKRKKPVNHPWGYRGGNS